MTRTVIQWPRVERDLTEFYAYIAMDKVAPAERLLVVAAESFERLATTPSLGAVWRSRWPQLKGIRLYPMPAPYRNYIILYRSNEQILEVIAIVHGARNLNRRLREILG